MENSIVCSNIKKREFICDELGEEELLMQLAEECSELSQAALKLRRALNKKNPTPISVEDASKNLLEEYLDVEMVIEIMHQKNGFGYLRLNNLDDLIEEHDKKLDRWIGRINDSKQTLKQNIGD